VVARPQFGTRRLFALTLLLAVALGIGKWAGLTDGALMMAALLMLPSIFLLAAALSGIVRDGVAMNRRQLAINGALLLAGILAVLLVVSLIAWLGEPRAVE
jgi:hypothetical protein